jgi:hypothetical protein
VDEHQRFHKESLMRRNLCIEFAAEYPKGGSLTVHKQPTEDVTAMLTLFQDFVTETTNASIDGIDIIFTLSFISVKVEEK